MDTRDREPLKSICAAWLLASKLNARRAAALWPRSMHQDDDLALENRTINLARKLLDEGCDCGCCSNAATDDDDDDDDDDNDDDDDDAHCGMLSFVLPPSSSTGSDSNEC